MDEMKWRNKAKNLVKAELVKRGIKYDELASRLQSMGVDESYSSINNKLNRGTFSFIFFMQCMEALGVKTFKFDY